MADVQATPPSMIRGEVDDTDESSSSISDPLNLTKEDGWEDLEPDEESENVRCLFSDEVFSDSRSMLAACKENFGFDFCKVQKEFDLDFIGTIKLVNYIRSEVATGNLKPDISSASIFQDDKYLKPVLENDALLYSLDDIEPARETGAKDASVRIHELEEQLSRIRDEFIEYKSMTRRTLNKSLDKGSELYLPVGSTEEKANSSRHEQAETGYFESYSYNAIHETMLKDHVRTDSYRDFIYDNKSLFQGKIVLDVGCGTGILSMFCARAGAKMVIAVDNSDIIDRARENAYDNGFGDVIKCIRGKIEEVELPVSKVDIIVSEWMGYCLLFEAMFDSVIWARDRYLAPDGLMVPSHATLQIAPISDPDLIDSHISFWHSVYGFKMSSMLLGIYDEALVQTLKTDALAAKACPFLQLSLHTTVVEDLTFVKDFQLTMKKDIGSLDGFAIWFDMFFMPSSRSQVSLDAVPKDMQQQDYVAFTTGPYGPETHWQQGVCLINRSKNPAKPIKKDHIIKGYVQYSKKEKESRLLDIGIGWEIPGIEKSEQKWSLQ